ncbi:hypothetical protein PGTUg99_001410, partial [Puccinia graminis f. sp. tritici]
MILCAQGLKSAQRTWLSAKSHPPHNPHDQALWAQIKPPVAIGQAGLGLCPEALARPYPRRYNLPSQHPPEFLPT